MARHPFRIGKIQVHACPLGHANVRDLGDWNTLLARAASDYPDVEWQESKDLQVRVTPRAYDSILQDLIDNAEALGIDRSEWSVPLG